MFLLILRDEKQKSYTNEIFLKIQSFHSHFYFSPSSFSDFLRLWWIQELKYRNIFYIRHFSFYNVGQSIYFEISTTCVCSVAFNLWSEEDLVCQPEVDFLLEIHLVELTVNWISRIIRSFGLSLRLSVSMNSAVSEIL